MTFIPSPFGKRTQHFVTHTNESNVQVSNFASNDLIYINKCETSEISVVGPRCMKVILDDNTNSTISVKTNAITTGFVEIMKCSDVNINFSASCSNRIKTLQLDTLKNCKVEFMIDEENENSEFLTMFCSQLTIISNMECENVTIVLKSGERVLHSSIMETLQVEDDFLQNNRSSIQFKTKFNLGTPSEELNLISIVTELVIREGCGYVSTMAEKEFKDRIQQEFDRRMEKFLNEQVFQSEEARQQKEEAKKKSKEISEKLKKKAQEISQDGSGSMLSEIRKFNKDKELNQSETRERTLLDVVGNSDDVMIDFGNNKSNDGKNNIIGNSNNSISDITGTPEDVREYEDDEEAIKEKAKQLAALIKSSKHCTVYTGAGISTSAKIPDYRGPKGVWVLKSSGRANEIKGFDIEQALPTFCHYAITHLVKKGLVKFVVSTNVDGLHRRSGITADEMSELHGNCYRETCVKCEKEYLRGFDVCKTVRDYTRHITNRHCDCGGSLKDTIIHFGENLPESELEKAINSSKNSDLALVLGTSMMVQPAASLPKMALKNKGGNLCIVNLQKTPYDFRSSLRVFAKTDEFMRLVMEELGELEAIDTEFDALAQWQ